MQHDRNGPWKGHSIWLLKFKDLMVRSQDSESVPKELQLGRCQTVVINRSEGAQVSCSPWQSGRPQLEKIKVEKSKKWSSDKKNQTWITHQKQVSKSTSPSLTAKGPGTIAHQRLEAQSTEPLVLAPVRQLLYGKLFQHDLPTSLLVCVKLVKLKGQLPAPQLLLSSGMQHRRPQQTGCFQVCSQTKPSA